MSPHILLIFPKPHRLKATRFGPPLGLLSIGARLESAGFTVTLMDLSADPTQEQRLPDLLGQADAVGLSIPSYAFETAEALIDQIGRLRPGLPVVAGGPDCNIFPRLVRGTRVTCIGEAEQTAERIFRGAISEPELLEACPGIVYATPSGEVRENSFGLLAQDLSLSPLPARHLVSYEAERGQSPTRQACLPRSTSMMTSRGCPLHCRFCARQALSHRTYRERSIDAVLGEVQGLHDQGYRMVWIADDNFGFHHDRACTILQGIADLGLTGLSFAYSLWVKAATPELLTLSRRAGVRIVSLGLEAGDDRALRYYRKPISVSETRRAVTQADKAGLFVVGNFIFGAPHETLEDMERTVELAMSLPLDTVNFKVLGYMAGSAIWREACREGKISPHERNVFADSRRGLGQIPGDELIAHVKRFDKMFSADPRRSVRLREKIMRLGLPYPLEGPP